MTTEEFKKLHEEALKEAVEIAVKHYLTKAYEPSLGFLKEKAKEAIPGEQYDGFVDMVLAPVSSFVKPIIDSHVDKISQGV